MTSGAVEDRLTSGAVEDRRVVEQIVVRGTPAAPIRSP